MAAREAGNGLDVSTLAPGSARWAADATTMLERPGSGAAVLVGGLAVVAALLAASFPPAMLLAAVAAGLAFAPAFAPKPASELSRAGGVCAVAACPATCADEARSETFPGTRKLVGVVSAAPVWLLTDCTSAAEKLVPRAFVSGARVLTLAAGSGLVIASTRIASDDFCACHAPSATQPLRGRGQCATEIQFQ